MSVTELATRLTAIKTAARVLADAERDTKAALLDAVGPGRTVHAWVDGADCGTVSVTKPAPPGLTVTDDAAFLAWCRVNAPHAIVETVRDIDRRAILTHATETGDLPDGVDLASSQSRPTVSVRMSGEQREALIDAFETGRLSVADVIGLLQAPAVTADA